MVSRPVAVGLSSRYPFHKGVLGGCYTILKRRVLERKIFVLEKFSYLFLFLLVLVISVKRHNGYGYVYIFLQPLITTNPFFIIFLL